MTMRRRLLAVGQLDHVCFRADATRGKRLPALACAALFVLVAMLAAPAVAPAADSLSIEPAIDRAVAHLEGTQLPDGGYGTRLPVRDSAAVAEALRLVRPQSSSLTQIEAYLGQAELADVDSLSRALVASPSAAHAAALNGAQRADGGFGLSVEYQSDALDTALALRALTALGERDAARRAANRLLKFAGAPGVWGADGGDVALTSEALLALDAYVRRLGSSAALDAARTASTTWIGSGQDDAGTWSGGPISARATAQAVNAIGTSLPAVASVNAGVDALLALQQPDGSWGDPFTTALAVQALRRGDGLIERDRVAQLPDPLVRSRDLAATPQIVESGKSITINAIVTNGGQAASSGASAEFFLEDPATGAEPVATAAVPDLAPGAQETVAGTFDVNRPGGRAKVYVVLRSPVDADRDLTNNSAALNLYVKIARTQFVRTRDWPRAGRDMQHSGTTPNQLHAVVDADPIWRAPAHGAHIVAEGRVYFGEGGQITARDAKTGALVWRRGGSYQDGRYRPPVYTRGWVLTAAEGTAGPLVARTGQLEGGVGGWGGVPPVFAADVVEVEGKNDPTFMYMANLPWINSGERCHLEPMRDITGSPYNVGDWSIRFNHHCDGDPLSFSGDGPRAFITSGAWLSGFDPLTAKGPNGEPSTSLFGTKLPGVTEVPSAALIDSLNQVIVGGWEGTSPSGIAASGTNPTGRGKVVAVDPANGSVYWTFTTDARLDGTPVEYRGTVIVVDRSGRVYGLDQLTGALKWSWTPADYVAPAVEQQGQSGQTLAISGRYLYVPHPDGKLYTLDARNGSQLSATTFPARPYDLAIDDTNNAIYVRTLDGNVGAYRTQELPDQCAPDPQNASPVASPIDRISVNNASNEPPSISADGRYVAFTTYGPAPSYTRQIHVRDLQTGLTESLPVSDQLGTNNVRTDKHLPVISDDGRYVGFIARQRDTVYNWDAEMMFVMDRQTGVVDPVLKHANGTAMSVQLHGINLRPSDRMSFAMSMSGDGRKVAFASYTNGIVAGDNDNGNDVFVVDRISGERTLVSKTRTGAPASAYSPALSGNGRYVTFLSSENLTGAPLASGLYDRQAPYLFRHDMTTGELRLVSALDDGTMVTGDWQRMSGDGRFVAFVSHAPSLYPTQYREPQQSWYGYSQGVFIWDAVTGRAEYASPNDSDRNPRTGLSRPVISDDGRFLAFHVAGFFAKGMTSWTMQQVVGRDRTAAKTRLLSHNEYGSAGAGEAVAPAMSADGSRIAFLSAAADLVPGDTNGTYDVFVHHRDREGLTPGEPIETGSELCPAGGEAEGYSDLAVTADDIEPSALEQGQSGETRVTVRNEGAAPSESTTVRLFSGSTLIGEESLPAIPAGGTAQPVFTWERIPDAGPHTLRAVVDPDGLVFEQDLGDNEAERSVEVSAPRLDLTVAPDRPAYGADAPVELTARLVNRSLAGRELRVVVALEDELGEPIATLHDDDVAVEADGEVSVGAGWNTLDTTAGGYVVRARAENAHGDELASASAPLRIEPDVRAELDLRTGGPVYDATGTAQLSALVRNLSANSTLAGARVQLSVAGTGDAWELAAGEIMQGRSTRVAQERSLRGVAPGMYAVTAVLVSADGAEIARDTGQFEVASSATDGDGVTGTLTVDPSEPQRFSTAAFRYAVTNAGNADIEGAKVRVRVNDLEDGATLKTLDEPRAVAVGTPATGALTTVVDLREERDYQVSLHLVLADGQERPLDREIIHVRPAPFTYGATLDPAPRDRVLVWACDPADEAVARAALGSTFATYGLDGVDPSRADQGGCSLQHPDERRRFLRLVRSGDYNQFWLLGAQPFDLGRGDDELAARVLHGDGLLVAGANSGFGLASFAGGNESPLGARRSGTAPAGAHQVDFAPNSAFAGLGAAVTGPFPGVRPLRATGIATTSWTSSGLTHSATTGTVNEFGRGTAIYLAPAPSAFADPAAAAAVLRRAADALRPDAAAPRATGRAWLDLWAEGVAPGTPAEFRAQLPQGASVPVLPAGASVAGDLLTLPFDATDEQRRSNGVWIKLPPVAGDATVSASVFYRDAQEGQMKRFGEPASATVRVVEDAATARVAALTALGQVIARTAGDRRDLQRIKDDVNATAVPATDPGTLEARLKALIDSIGTLERMGSANAERARTALARLITYVQYDHYLAGGA